MSDCKFSNFSAISWREQKIEDQSNFSNILWNKKYSLDVMCHVSFQRCTSCPKYKRIFNYWGTGQKPPPPPDKSSPDKSPPDKNPPPPPQ